MNYEELTPLRRDGYHGFMTEEQQRGQGVTNEAAPKAAGENEGSIEPIGILEVTQEIAEEAKKQEKLTSNALKQTAETVGGARDGLKVLQEAEFVAAAAAALSYNADLDKQNKSAQEVLEKLEGDGGLRKKIDAIQKLISAARLSAQGEDGKQTRDPIALNAILNQAPEIAKLAKQLSEYYEEAKISNEYDDPFKQIVSFEELMTKFNITNTDPEFKPDGQFPLLKISKYYDEFGREMIEEEAHPENFLRWVQKKIEFYHDFDPMASIDLFQGMYIVAGSRKVSMYEILVDFDAYFAHRVRKSGKLKVQEPDLVKAHQDGRYRDIEDIQRELTQESLSAEQKERLQRELRELQEHDARGYYTKFEVDDPNNPGNKKRVKAYVSQVGEVDQVTRKEGLHRVFYVQSGKDDKGNIAEVEVPVQAWLSSRDQWEPKQNDAYDAIKNDIMYEVWLMMKNHNMDVTYRQEAMPSEVPLKEKMAQLYSDNIWTRTRDRLLKLLKSASTTKREDENGNIYSEAEVMMKDPEAYKKVQGRLGKARQRAIAFLYHISEANAPYAGYQIDGGMNPAKEMLRGKDGKDYSETFYKSLLRQTLEKNLGYKTYDIKKNSEESQDCHVAVELIHLLNETRVPTKKKKPGTQEWDGSDRARFDWEKFDLADLVLMDNAGFLKMAADKLHVSGESFAKLIEGLEKKYAGNVVKLDQLRKLRTQSVAERKQDLVDLADQKLGKGDAKSDGKAREGFLKAKDMAFGGLDAFAISTFVRSFGSEYTPGINPYAHIRYSLEARDRMRQALRDTLVRTEELDAFEALYAEEWAYTFSYHTGISARNDMGGIGHDAWSKVINTEYYRLRQSGGGNYLGNVENLYGIHRLGVDFWQGMTVKVDGHSKYDKTLYEMLTGLTAVADVTGRKTSGNFDINKDIESFEFTGNAMRQFVGDHLGHAIDLFIDITQKQEFNLDKLITKDNWGRLVINNEEMQKMIDSTWKHMRYGFDNFGFLYDNIQYGWLYDEAIDEKGAVSRTPHFGFAELKELMFSKELREMNMYDRKDVSSWSKPDGKMGRNVFAYVIAAQIYEHTKYGGHYRIYSADEVAMIMTAFMEHSARIMKGADGEAIRLSGFFSQAEVVRILAMAHSLIWMLYFRDYGVSMSGGFLFGLFEAFALVMKQVGEGVRL